MRNLQRRFDAQRAPPDGIQQLKIDLDVVLRDPSGVVDSAVGDGRDEFSMLAGGALLHRRAARRIAPELGGPTGSSDPDPLHPFAAIGAVTLHRLPKSVL